MYQCLSCATVFDEPFTTRGWSEEYGADVHQYCPDCGEEDAFEEYDDEEDEEDLE